MVEQCFTKEIQKPKSFIITAEIISAPSWAISIEKILSDSTEVQTSSIQETSSTHEMSSTHERSSTPEVDASLTVIGFI